MRRSRIGEHDDPDARNPTGERGIRLHITGGHLGESTADAVAGVHHRPKDFYGGVQQILMRG